MRGRGFAVDRTAAAGDAVELAREAADAGVSELAVCGGDGTVNEVVRGLAAADHLGEVTLSVVPAGTANLLARMIGVETVDRGIEVADTGDVRTVDVGMAGGEPFLVSCIAGFPAEASVAASSDLKERFGTLAFVITGLGEAVEFDGLNIHLETGDGLVWEGDALCLLVGNARRFVEAGGQANMEDGLFDVAVVEQKFTPSLVAEAISHRVLGRGTEGVFHVQADSLSVTGQDGPITFSRDGEVGEYERLDLSIRPRTLDLRVGPTYDPEP
jgi:YegS/Rv2252/BmrU family lipid kinase